MSGTILTKQFILDASGKPVGVILPIDEYEEIVKTIQECLARTERAGTDEAPRPSSRSLYGILQRLEGRVAATDVLDQDLRELWSAWDKGEQS